MKKHEAHARGSDSGNCRKTVVSLQPVMSISFSGHLSLFPFLLSNSGPRARRRDRTVARTETTAFETTPPIRAADRRHGDSVCAGRRARLGQFEFYEFEEVKPSTGALFACAASSRPLGPVGKLTMRVGWLVVERSEPPVHHSFWGHACGVTTRWYESSLLRVSWTLVLN